MNQYDLITIGGGSGGIRASRVAAELGAAVAVVEAGPFGGTCVNAGCIPKKLLHYAAHYHDDFTDSASYGWEVPKPEFCWQRLIENKDREIQRLNSIYEGILERHKVERIRGQARVTGPHSVEVNGRTIQARYILLATGSTPTIPSDIVGHSLGITSDAVFHLPQQPKRALILGGGYIGVELASILAGLSTAVTLVYRGPRILNGFDHETAALLEAALTARGIQRLPQTRIKRIAANADGTRTVILSTGAEHRVDTVIFATGRHANIADLNLEQAGIAINPAGWIATDAELQTSVPSIFAIGDAVGKGLLTPVAIRQGILVAERLFAGIRRPYDELLVPTAVFSLPELATVGLTEDAAQQAGRAVRIFRANFRPLKHSMTRSGERIFMKLVADETTSRVLGVHMVGDGASEIVQTITVALKAGATTRDFLETLAIHPTTAEELVTITRTTYGQS